VLDAAADHVAVSDWDHVGHAIARVDDDAGEGALVDLATGPGGGQGEHGLDGDVEARHVEGLEHDLGRVLAVLWGVERRLGE